jgi:hypothetical protein
VSPREKRFARNAELFRAVNDEIAELSPQWGSDGFQIICECSNTGCQEMLSVSLGKFERVRMKPGRFLVVPGHVDLEVEDIVERRGAYEVVTRVGADH